jgi:hypothetical protein
MVKGDYEFSFSVIDILDVMKISFRNKYNLTCIDSKSIMSSPWAEDGH